MTHMGPCNEAYLEFKKEIFQNFGERISSYVENGYDIVRSKGMDHTEALEAIKSDIPGDIRSYLEAKEYIEQVCHQSTAGLDRASDLAHQVIAVPEFGPIALGIAAIGTAAALYFGRNKLFGGKFDGLFYNK